MTEDEEYEIEIINPLTDEQILAIYKEENFCFKIELLSIEDVIARYSSNLTEEQINELKNKDHEV